MLLDILEYITVTDRGSNREARLVFQNIDRNFTFHPERKQAFLAVAAPSGRITCGQVFPKCWPEMQSVEFDTALFTLPNFEGVITPYDLGRAMARFSTLQAYADKRDELEKARQVLTDPNHPLSGLVSMEAPVRKEAGYYFADLGWLVWRVMVWWGHQCPAQFRVTPCCLDAFWNTGGTDIQRLESGLSQRANSHNLHERLVEMSAQISKARNIQRSAEREGLGFLRCPLSGEVMKDPVVASDGWSYEREAIEGYVQACVENHVPIASPRAQGRVLDRAVLFPNVALKNVADGLNEQQPYEELIPVCPISQDKFAASTVPVIISSGHSMTKSKIKEWFNGKEPDERLCPMTRKIVVEDPVDNLALSKAIKVLKGIKFDSMEERKQKREKKKRKAPPSGSGSGALEGSKRSRAAVGSSESTVIDLTND